MCSYRNNERLKSATFYLTEMETNSRELRQKRIELLVHSYKHICRFCTEESFLQPILQPTADGTGRNNVFNDERQIGMLLSTYLQYDLEQEMGLPKYICDDCIDTLSRWHRFQVRYVTATEDLQHALEQIEKSVEPLPNARTDLHEQRSFSPQADEQCGEIVYSITMKQEDGQQLVEYHAEQNEQEIEVHVSDSLDAVCHNNTAASGSENESLESISNLPSSGDQSKAADNGHQTKSKRPGRQCPVCGVLVKAKLKHHLMRHADSTGCPFKCDRCDKAYRYKRSLVEHVMHVHENLRVRCEICSKQFCSRDVLRVHKKLHVNSDQQYRCETCGRCFKQLMYLRKHRSVHDGEPQFQCDHCGKAFRLKQQLQQHIRVHTGEKPFECPLCSKRFRSRNNLRQHNRSHLNEKPFRCASCAVSYSNKQSLIRHENSSKCRRTKLGASEAAAGT
uniref:Uncharacterized protein n=1 Tax=Anopheles atroparvus TaxID=41427 RepID=A0A182IKX6_ANOAO